MRIQYYLRSEHRALQSVGKIIMNDTTYTLTERMENWKEYLKEYYMERDIQLMRIFRERNGFDAIDDEAKRQLIDPMFYDTFHRYPYDDYERNRYTFSQQVDRHLMRIGWKPFEYAPTEKQVRDAFTYIR